MRITKFEGAMISILLMNCYTFPFFIYAENTTWAQQLIVVFIFGVFLLFLRNIPPGTKAELVFFGKALDFYWDDGYCLVPSIFPILHNIGIYLLWNLKQQYSNVVGLITNDHVNIDHRYDQAQPRFDVRTETSLFRMEVYRLMGLLSRWFFGFKKGDTELLYQRLGFRIIVLAIIGATISPEKAKEVPRKIEKSYPSLLSPVSGQCVEIPNGATAFLSINSSPKSVENIRESVKVEMNGSFSQSTWSQVQQDIRMQTYPSRINLITTSAGDGKICF